MCSEITTTYAHCGYNVTKFAQCHLVLYSTKKPLNCPVQRATLDGEPEGNICLECRTLRNEVRIHLSYTLLSVSYSPYTGHLLLDRMKEQCWKNIGEMVVGQNIGQRTRNHRLLRC